MKKIFFGLGLCFLGSFAQAQNGLEGVVVEKYYIANAADNAADPTLPIGSVTYRVYVDMLPGYKFKMAYGSATHPLSISTTTSFYNEPNYGGVSPTLSAANAKKRTANLDSYITAGGACAGNNGIMKTEDNGVGNFVIDNNCLRNTSSRMGIALTTQDGMIAGTVPAIATFGTQDVSMLDAGATSGNLFSITNGSWGNNAGASDLSASNKVLIGQFTTDGVLSFSLNIQLQNPAFQAEKYVVENPVNGELVIPSLVQTWGPPVAPTVSITAPSNGASIITGDAVTISATAADADGTVASVEFFNGATSLGVDNTTPFSISWNATAGANQSITAKATDNEGDFTTSAAVVVSVANNQAPTVSITAPSTGSTSVIGDVISITASSSDVDGTVASVEFFVDGTSVGTDVSSPFEASYTSTLGAHSITATATDDRGLTAVSSRIDITGLNNVPPTVSLTAPTTGSSVLAPAVVTISANAADSDGSITKVEFYVNGIKVGEDATSAYSFDWTSVIGTASITAKSYDNKGAITTSAAVVIEVADPNALPYKIVNTKNTCLPTTFSLPIAVVDSIENVIGFDMVLDYDATLVTPTGVTAKTSSLLNASYYDITNYINVAAKQVNISVSLNQNAPVGSTFAGVGNILSVEFTKTANFQSVDTAFFTILSLNESYYNGVSPNKSVKEGNYSTYKDSTFTASLKFWNLNEPIKYDAANPNTYAITNVYGTTLTGTNKSATAVQPNTAGDFSYNIWNGEAISIERQILGTTEVMTVISGGGDVFLMKQVATSNPAFTPSIYQMLSMDVNLDGVISSGDISQTNQRIILNLPEFKQAWNYDQAGISNGQPSRDWIFVDSLRLQNNAAYQISTSYPSNDNVGFSKFRVPVTPSYLPVTVADYSNCPLITSETYKGILLGDANGNYASIAANGLLKSNTSDVVVFDIANAVVSENYIDVPVSVNSSNNIQGLDFSLKFDESKLEFNTIIDQNDNLDEYFSFNQNDKTLRFTATSNTNGAYLESGKNAIIIRFNKLSNSVTQNDLTSVNAYINGDLCNTEFALTNSIVENNRVISIYPNPASDKLNVQVSENSKVQMYDMNGNQVIMEASINANQNQALELNNLANGVYFVKIYNDSFVKMQKIIIAK
ncbi:MAG: Ig-like domain-containing protein [Bacteroidota bacterium]